MSDFYGSDGAVWSEEHDSVPLKQRLKLLLATSRNAYLSAISDGIVVKKEYEECDSQDFHSNCSSQYGKSGCLTREQSPTGGTEVEKYTSPNQMSAGEIINASYSSSLLPSVSSNFPVKVKVEQADDKGVSTLENCVNNSSSVTDVQATDKFKTETADDIVDDLDHVVLRERQRMLLSRKESSSATEVQQDNSSGWCGRVVDRMVQETTGIGQCMSSADDQFHSSAGNNFNEVSKSMEAGSAKMVAGVPRMTQISTTPQYCQDDKVSSSAKTGNINRICSSENPSSKHESSGGAELLSGGNKRMLSSDITELGNVKVEPFDSSELEGAHKNSVRSLTFSNVVQVKTEFGVPDDSFIKDKLDHMFLSERIKLLSSRNLPHLDICGISESSSKLIPSALDCQPIASEYPKPLKINRPRKRRKTATDSVGTALEEDAPGLLQVLMEKGVSVDEMKLYGQAEYDGALDESSLEESFSELEAVISKLFSQRTSLLKFAPIRCNKGEKASYCLACLFSLVEQARYLRFRNWPVEWGWCRDLQSFIFVFERHNRIVLERPEYGYATYFFELLDSTSVDWQIKRLVTAMKLTSCSRVTLIENKALVIGEDLTKGEARVLMEYGWIPNSGLGTMLNYCDRVVHDSKNEKNISEWRSKIGKLLMDGYNGGTIVAVDILGKLSEYNVNRSPQIKLELS